jgi:hypothetical protein
MREADTKCPEQLLVCFCQSVVNEPANFIKAVISTSDGKCKLQKDDPGKQELFALPRIVNLLQNYLIRNPICYSVITWSCSYFDNYLFIYLLHKLVNYLVI